MAPKVQTLAEASADLASGFDEQRNLVNEQIGTLGAKYGAQKEALEGTRVKAFNTINDQATGRGMSFSGIPLGEQADYLADKYLPGLTNLANQENEERMGFRKEIAGYNQQQNQMAVSRIDQQTSALNSWNLQQQQLEAQRRENEANRSFQAGQNALSRSAASSGAGAGASAYSVVQDFLDSRTGADRKVSPTTWKQAASMATRLGLNFEGANGFASQFWGYANDKYWQEYKNIKV